MILKGHALELSVKPGLPGGRENVAVLMHETSCHEQGIFNLEKYNDILHILLHELL